MFRSVLSPLTRQWLGVLSCLAIAGALPANGRGDDGLLQSSVEEVDLHQEVTPLLPKVAETLLYFTFLPPSMGALAPGFSLENLEGKSVTLESFRGKKPVLLVFASVSSFIYRRTAMESINEFRELNKDLETLVIYTIEANPAGGDPSPYTGGQWIGKDNVTDRVLVRQPKTLAERTQLASAMAKRFRLDGKGILVDRMDNAVWKAYGGLPNALYLVDKKGKVFFKESWAGQSREVNADHNQLSLALRALQKLGE